ncbi:MAG: hypothetical protein RL250_1391, partial [Verrucomicrobiota bacterium]
RDAGGMAEARARQPERRPARLVARGARIRRRLRLRRERLLDGSLEVALREQAELPEARRVGGGEQLKPVAEEARAMARMLGRLGDYPGAFRAGHLRGVMLAERLPEMRVEVGQAPLEQLGQFAAQGDDPVRREPPGGFAFQDAEPTLDQAQVKEGQALLLIARVQRQLGPAWTGLIAEVSGQRPLRIPAEVLRQLV